MILITTQCFPPEIGGIQTYMLGLASSLAERGHAVHVLCDAAKGGSTDQDPQFPFRVTRFAGPKPWRRFRKARAVAKALSDPGTQAVIADTWKSLEWLPARHGIQTPLLCLAHGMEFPPNPSSKKKKRIVSALGKASIVAPNSAYVTGLVEPYLPGGVELTCLNPAAFHPGPAEPHAQNRLAQLLPGDAASPVIATLGRLEPRKGQDKIIGAVADLKDRYPGLTYLVAGTGPDTERLKTLAEAKSVNDRVLFLGRIDDALRNALLARIDLFAMPARIEGASVEGFGIVYLEAALFGKPSLAGRAGGAGDAVLDGETGLLCDGSSQEDVTRALDALLADPARLKTMGQAAQARTEREFVWPDAAARFETALGIGRTARTASPQATAPSAS